MTYFSRNLSEYKHLTDNNPTLYKNYFVVLLIIEFLSICINLFFSFFLQSMVTRGRRKTTNNIVAD